MTVSEAPWEQLHPASVVVNLVPRAWRVVRGAWPILLAVFFGGRADPAGLLDFGLLLAFSMLTVGSTVVHFLTLRYRVADGRLEIATGLLNRQVRVIDPARIQNLELTRNVFHRMSGLVEVRLETASGTEVEGLLSALDSGAAQRLVDALEAERRRRMQEEPTEEEPPVLVKSDPWDLIRYGATATRFGAVIVLFGVGMEILQVAERERVEQLGGLFNGLGLFAIGLAAISGSWLLGIGAALVRHYGFGLTQRGRTLVAAEGLLTRRQVELRVDKVQLVTVSQPLIRRWLGFGSVLIETAAAPSSDRGGTQRSEAMIPVVETGDIDTIVRRAVPQLDVDLRTAELKPPHPRALVLALFSSVLRAAVFSGLVSWLFWPWGLLALALIPAGIVSAVLDYRFQGWLVSEEVVVARRGWWNRRTFVVALHKLQSVEVV